IAPRVTPCMDARGDAHAVKRFRNPSRRGAMPTRLNDLETLYGADGYRHIIFLHSFFWLRLAAEELSRNSFPVFP
ncbi:hypothetical protein, partial [Rubripirellula obstinata]|uniref:hypothetical protein n=1 Tax=Rubripirellula obstinata TaxID=406547 RepID=UPI001EE48ED6